MKKRILRRGLLGRSSTAKITQNSKILPTNQYGKVKSRVFRQKMAMEEWNFKEREKLLLKKKSGKLRKKFGIWGSDRGTSLKLKSKLYAEIWVRGGGGSAPLHPPPIAAPVWGILAFNLGAVVTHLFLTMATAKSGDWCNSFTGHLVE